VPVTRVCHVAGGRCINDDGAVGTYFLIVRRALVIATVEGRVAAARDLHRAAQLPEFSLSLQNINSIPSPLLGQVCPRGTTPPRTG
jgi:hypothetical protein